MTLSLISFLNPVTIETAIIIMANPRATPIIAIRIIGLEMANSFSFEKVIRRAIKSSKFNVEIIKFAE